MLGARTRTPLGLGHAGADDGLASAVRSVTTCAASTTPSKSAARGHLVRAGARKRWPRVSVAGRRRPRTARGSRRSSSSAHEPAHWARERTRSWCPSAATYFGHRDAGDHALPARRARARPRSRRGDAAGRRTRTPHRPVLAALECADVDALAAREALWRPSSGCRRRRTRSWTEGPLKTSSTAAVSSATSDTIDDEAPRRGVRRPTSPCGMRSPIERFGHEVLQLLGVARCRSNAGISSVPISNASVCRLLTAGLLPRLGLGRRGTIFGGLVFLGGLDAHHVLHVRRAHRLGDGAHA